MLNNDKEIQNKEILIDELKDIYALIEVSHYAMRHHNVIELDAVTSVLNTAYEKLFRVYDREESRLRELDAEKEGNLKAVN